MPKLRHRKVREFALLIFPVIFLVGFSLLMRPKGNIVLGTTEGKLIGTIDGIDTTWYVDGSGQRISVRILVKHEGGPPKWWGRKKAKITKVTWITEYGDKFPSKEAPSMQYPAIHFKQEDYILYFSGDVSKLPNPTLPDSPKLKQLIATVEIEGEGYRELKIPITGALKPI